jgi:hypothetical protein
MDEADLRSQLNRAELVLGDVADTVPTFFRDTDAATVGMVVFDLDLYTSTTAALDIFNTDDQNVLPRVPCYFDDIIGNLEVGYTDATGVRRAIAEAGSYLDSGRIDKVSFWPYLRDNEHIQGHSIYLYQRLNQELAANSATTTE